jgi:hypothetical protein
VGGGAFYFAFLDNEAWYRTGWVTNGAVLTFPQKLLYFGNLPFFNGVHP